VPTHIDDELDPRWAPAQARSVFDGRLKIVREGAVYDV